VKSLCRVVSCFVENADYLLRRVASASSSAASKRIISACVAATWATSAAVRCGISWLYGALSWTDNPTSCIIDHASSLLLCHAHGCPSSVISVHRNVVQLHCAVRPMSLPCALALAAYASKKTSAAGAASSERLR
jgi:hypothetical protein